MMPQKCIFLIYNFIGIFSNLELLPKIDFAELETEKRKKFEIRGGMVESGVRLSSSSLSVERLSLPSYC